MHWVDKDSSFGIFPVFGNGFWFVGIWVYDFDRFEDSIFWVWGLDRQDNLELNTKAETSVTMTRLRGGMDKMRHNPRATR